MSYYDAGRAGLTHTYIGRSLAPGGHGTGPGGRSQCAPARHLGCPARDRPGRGHRAGDDHGRGERTAGRPRRPPHLQLYPRRPAPAQRRHGRDRCHGARGHPACAPARPAPVLQHATGGRIPCGSAHFSRPRHLGRPAGSRPAGRMQPRAPSARACRPWKTARSCPPTWRTPSPTPAAPPSTTSGLSRGHNLFGNSFDGSGYAASDLLDVDPRLGPLQDNGGPTQTMALLPGSPALNAGDNTGAPTSDQRGPGFPRVVGGTIDIGALEVQGAGGLAVAGFPATVTAGAPRHRHRFEHRRHYRYKLRGHRPLREHRPPGGPAPRLHIHRRRPRSAGCWLGARATTYSTAAAAATC